MYISRGFQETGEKAGQPARELPARTAPQSVDYHLVHDRLTMLERLAALRAGGTLSEAEFLVEKERIMALPAEELVLRPAQAPPRGASLLGRILDWKILTLGLLIGLGLGLFARPDGALTLLDRLGVSLPG
jgi:hypothetical protein